MRLLLAVSILALTACASDEPKVAAKEMPTAGGSCADLAALKLPNVTITRAETAGKGAPASNAAPPGSANLPAFCRIAATLKPSADSDIRIEVWMPAAGWNGKFLGTGNGGAAGSIGYPALADGVARGYAAVATDTGHQGGAADYSFAVGHPEKLTDNAWRAVHEMTVAGKAITRAYYSASPRKSYWSACSTGGRQGLKEAQKFPYDYDAIVAGAPANDYPGLPGVSTMMQVEMTKPGGLPVSKLPLLKEGFIAACDAADGVTDRVVNNPRTCRFDPEMIACKDGAATGCLLPGEVVSARTIYAGLRNADGSLIYPGMSPGGEPGWGGLAGAFAIGGNYFRNVVHGGDAAWTADKFDVATDIPLAKKIDGGAMAATSTNISAFLAGGGKLILYHGWTDGLIPSTNTINYYESLVKANGPGAASTTMRLFMMPGVDHCRGGDGASNADFLGALEAWVEHGKAPEVIVASKSLPGGATRTRPLCAWPKVAKYSGNDSTDDAANFSCVAP